MNLLGKALSIGVLAGTVSVVAAKLIDVAYNKVSGKYITFTGKDLRYIPEYKENEK